MAEFHAIATVFPLLEGAKLEALAADIREHGLRESAWTYEGKVLDGRNRATACIMAGVPFKTREFKGSRLDALAFVWSENLCRRHLNPSQAAVAEAKRAKFIAEYAAEVEKMKGEAKGRKAEGGKAGGKVAGRGRPKADRDRQQIAAEKPDQRKTSDKRARAAGTNRRYLEAAEGLLDTAPEKLEPVEKGDKTLSQVLCEEKKAAKVKAREEAAKNLAVDDETYNVIHADFRDGCKSIPDTSVALLFADPPYDRKSLGLFDSIGEVAARLLIDGGSLITFCGQYVLPDVMASLSGHLRYFWICACQHSGTAAQMREYGIKVLWKPMLWYVKGAFRVDRQAWIEDMIVSQKEKAHHDWQQSVVEATHFIRALTLEGETVLDPCCGGGTTAVAARDAGRKWITFDVDGKAVATARKRLKR